jgi:hypothetical protein
MQLRDMVLGIVLVIFLVFAVWTLSGYLGLTGTADKIRYSTDSFLKEPQYYTGIDYTTLRSDYHLTVLPIKTVRQQVTNWTCGPVAAMNVMTYYGVNFTGGDSDEFRVSDEMHVSTTGVANATTTLGATPDVMAAWFTSKGWNATWGTNGSIQMLRDNLKSGKPTLVEWIDWGGHWVVVVGYDDRGTPVFWDDVIIFADSSDCHDDRVDGITYFNAGEFEAMWFDSHYFPENMRNRAYVLAVPGTTGPGTPVER